MNLDTKKIAEGITAVVVDGLKELNVNCHQHMYDLLTEAYTEHAESREHVEQRFKEMQKVLDSLKEVSEALDDFRRAAIEASLVNAGIGPREAKKAAWKEIPGD